MIEQKTFYVGQTCKENPEIDDDYLWRKVMSHDKFDAICRATEHIKDKRDLKFKVRDTVPNSLNVLISC